jgi:hypothetical protein
MANRPRGGFNGDSFFFRPAIPGEGLKDKITFYAHIASVRDSSSPNWGTYQDAGRADPVVMYNSLNRSIGVSFLIYATDAKEHDRNYELMKKLGNLTYPIVKAGSGYNAPHVFFKIGKLLTGYGVITSLDYDWSGEQPWIDERPLITDASIGIMVLGDRLGNRPRYNNGKYEYFGG